MDGGARGGAAARMFGLLGRMGRGWWIVAFAVTAGTNLIDFFVIAAGGAATPAFTAAVAVRVVLVFWLGYALTRRLAGVERPAAPTAALGRYALFMIGVTVLMGAMTGLATLIVGNRGVATTGAVSALLGALAGLLLVRLFAWQAALAVGDRTLGPTGAWRRLAGQNGALVLAYLAILPVVAAHHALTHYALQLFDRPDLLAAVAIVDGLVSALQLALSAALAVVAWTIAAGSRPLREAPALA
ncbi:MAG: hypothetical protein ACK4K7_00805 [Allosphingosinicella sp.]|uniref:hypothetical protein n=1 Tax=Allosphingosinicella sp. TaxID=2823234 RepID=UPI003935F9FF